ncbi:hypothetical protein ZIOFF_066432 [Zingiber officinale]|uniref:Uncharacterized protein n=1 Tax=Zingiber officinale TaxID=94328 RepID=A0A8J5K989_ZINOF|nr:hypothetical protein ZIOFF_066432 [Zingiber officinale]
MLGKKGPTTIIEGSALTSIGSNIRRGTANLRKLEEKSVLWCDFCNKPRHTQETYWKIHGNPANFKGKSGEKNGRIFPTANEAMTTASTITKEHLEQLLALLASNPSSNTPNVSVAHTGNEIIVFSCGFGISAPWIIDFGASDHMTNSLKLLKLYSPCPENKKVKIAYGSFSPIAGKGSVQISENIDLKSVLYVPKLTCNLLSDRSSGKTIGNAKMVNGLYYFEDILPTLFFSSSSARESRLLLRLEGKQTAEMSSLGLNFCYPPGIGVARPKSATPFITSQFHLAKALSSSRLLLSPSTSGAPHRRLPAPPSSISTASTAADDEEGLQEELAEEEEDGDPTVEVRFLDRATEPGSITEWELDFCSRPILDDRGKKLWELVVCDSTLSLQFTRFFPNNVINSVTLKDAIASISDKLGVPLPERIRFFRSQMQTIITRACNELGIKPIPSKRCLSLILWLEERYETVYTRHPGFQQGSKPLLTLDNPFPMELPDNLFGEKWAFVQLPFSGLLSDILQSFIPLCIPLKFMFWCLIVYQCNFYFLGILGGIPSRKLAVVEEMSSFETRYAFGGSLDFELLGFEIDDNTLVPGLAVASSRAKPLAAWMNGLEICSVEADISRACLILSVGVSTRYTYATYPKNASTTKEAEAWEAAKKACGGLHFLAIQEELDSEDCVGFWLLLDLPPPPV